MYIVKLVYFKDSNLKGFLFQNIDSFSFSYVVAAAEDFTSYEVEEITFNLNNNLPFGTCIVTQSLHRRPAIYLLLSVM